MTPRLRGSRRTVPNAVELRLSIMFSCTAPVLWQCGLIIDYTDSSIARHLVNTSVQVDEDVDAGDDDFGGDEDDDDPFEIFAY